MKLDLDQDKNTPSDYALLVRNVRTESLHDNSLEDTVKADLAKAYTKEDLKHEEDLEIEARNF